MQLVTTYQSDQAEPTIQAPSGSSLARASKGRPFRLIRSMCGPAVFAIWILLPLIPAIAVLLSWLAGLD